MFATIRRMFENRNAGQQNACLRNSCRLQIESLEAREVPALIAGETSFFYGAGSQQVIVRESTVAANLVVMPKTSSLTVSRVSQADANLVVMPKTPLTISRVSKVDANVVVMPTMSSLVVKSVSQADANVVVSDVTANASKFQAVPASTFASSAGNAAAFSHQGEKVGILIGML